ncbi:hypothetical protein EV361DRAFT_794534 [Lentinula raphanica]|nr:hypothetical protein EV360DRAFT_45708 [Lentinula raphanica]KAJ3771811.1 hypothetical protein FB446DRAFT_644565 [Lentinula raphanica]KAJ3974345.1 hypothetical protein EV361DRAFT_794534 [Lentinula raphanica]
MAKAKARFALLSQNQNIQLILQHRTIIVRLISTAQTGFFYTTQRVRQGLPLSAIKYDPRVKRRVLFVENKKSKKG